MDNENKFPQQEAPEKNTDDAFVQVGERGEPTIPENEANKGDKEKNNHVTTLDKR